MDNFFTDCIADLAIPQSWKYSGWHNDACPSFVCDKYQIFVDHADPKQRELGEDSQRFHIIISDEYGECGWTKSFDAIDDVIAFLATPQIDRLTEEYKYWCKEQKLPCIDAQEYLFDPSKLDDEQMEWLSNFAKQWENASINDTITA